MYTLQSCHLLNVNISKSDPVVIDFVLCFAPCTGDVKLLLRTAFFKTETQIVSFDNMAPLGSEECTTSRTSRVMTCVNFFSLIQTLLNGTSPMSAEFFELFFFNRHMKKMKVFLIIINIIIMSRNLCGLRLLNKICFVVG